MFSLCGGNPITTGRNIVDMFNKACSVRKRQEVLESFCAKDSTLRVVVASTSFGMGVDCADIRKVIHWGPPEDLDTYARNWPSWKRWITS